MKDERNEVGRNDAVAEHVRVLESHVASDLPVAAHSEGSIRRVEITIS